MEELIRDRMHAALDVEPTPPHLRAKIMSSLPVAERSRRAPAPSFDWARTWIAALLVLAIVAGFAYIAHQMTIQTVRHSPPAVTPAQLWSPDGIVLGPDGAVYFSDAFSGYVFRVQPDKSLLTVAGTRPAVPINQGDAGSGGPATQAYLFGPEGLAIDHSGNLYIADTEANRIRKIDRRGVIRTVAGTGIADATQAAFGGDGGPATAALLNTPTGVAVDAQGAIYIADFNNGAVRRVDPSGGISSLNISTLPLSRSLFHPHDVSFDAAGNLYVASGDTAVAPTGKSCEIVRRSADGFWSRLAGTGVCGFAGDGGPAIDAEISSGGAMAFDSAGNMYFTDTFNHRIRRIDPNGVITTFLVDDEFPLGIAIEGDVLYIAEQADVSLTPSAAGRVRGINLSNDYLVLVVDSHTPIHTSG